jgi:hypothetical protein
MNWSDITLGQYQHSLMILGTDFPDFNKEVELVCYLLNLPKEEVVKMPIPKYKEYAAKLDFMTKKHNEKMRTEFEVEGQKFDVIWQMQKRTAGQMIDLTMLTKEPELIYDRLHELMAVVCIPKGKDYDGDIAERAQLFKDNLTMDIVFPIADFFLKTLKSSLEAIRDYLTTNAQRGNAELRQMIKDSMNIGDGTPHWMN